MRTALVLLFLLALASVPGLGPAAARHSTRSRCSEYFAAHPRLGAAAGPAVAVRRVRLALVRGDLPAAVRLARRLPRRRASGCTPRALRPAAGGTARLDRLPAHVALVETAGADAVLAAPAGRCARLARRQRDRRRGTARCRPRRATCARPATCCSTSRLVAAARRHRARRRCSATRAPCWSRRATGFSNTVLAYDDVKPGRRFDADRLGRSASTLDDFAATYADAARR